MKSVKVQAQVRLKAYPTIEGAVESGVIYGWNRAHKHTDVPDPDYAKEQIVQSIMNELSEIFDFE